MFPLLITKRGMMLMLQTTKEIIKMRLVLTSPRGKSLPQDQKENREVTYSKTTPRFSYSKMLESSNSNLPSTQLSLAELSKIGSSTNTISQDNNIFYGPLCRSHVFSIEKAPGYLNDKVVQNVNVRGKRGNIVQVYPAVEYDFIPNTLELMVDQYVHFQ